MVECRFVRSVIRRMTVYRQDNYFWFCPFLAAFARNFLRRINAEFADADDFAGDMVEYVGWVLGEEAVALGLGEMLAINPFMNPLQVPPDGGKKVNILGTAMLIRVHGRDT